MVFLIMRQKCRLNVEEPKPTVALDDDEGKGPELTQLRSSHEGAVDEIFRSVHWLIHHSNKYIFYKLALIHWLICHSTIHKNLFLVRVVFKLVFCKSSLCVLEDFPPPTVNCDSPLKGWSEWRKVSLYTADDDDAQKSQ